MHDDEKRSSDQINDLWIVWNWLLTNVNRNLSYTAENVDSWKTNSRFKVNYDFTNAKYFSSNYIVYLQFFIESFTNSDDFETH